MSDKPVTAMSIKMIAKVTSYEDGQLCGILDSMYFKEPFTFAGVISMIEIMETTFDAVGFPDKALLPRTFGKAKERMRRHEIDLEKIIAARNAGVSGTAGATGSNEPGSSGSILGTFEIFVNFRLNAEWQGKLHWVEKDITKEFTSIVNMMRLLDEALAQE